MPAYLGDGHSCDAANQTQGQRHSIPRTEEGDQAMNKPHETKAETNKPETTANQEGVTHMDYRDHEDPGHGFTTADANGQGTPANDDNGLSRLKSLAKSLKSGS